MRFRLRSVEVVIGSIAVQLIQLVCLAQAIPRPIVVLVYVDSGTVAFDRCVGVFHLEVLVAHQSPSREAAPVQLDRPLEVNHSLVVVTAQGVVIPHRTARLGPILIT